LGDDVSEPVVDRDFNIDVGVLRQQFVQGGQKDCMDRMLVRRNANGPGRPPGARLAFRAPPRSPRYGDPPREQPLSKSVSCLHGHGQSKNSVAGGLAKDGLYRIRLRAIPVNVEDAGELTDHGTHYQHIQIYEVAGRATRKVLIRDVAPSHDTDHTVGDEELVMHAVIEPHDLRWQRAASGGQK
jgi:hypothetical protein